MLVKSLPLPITVKNTTVLFAHRFAEVTFCKVFSKQLAQAIVSWVYYYVIASA